MTQKDIIKCMITQNNCYKQSKKMTPKGIVVHDTAAGNPFLQRYTQPSNDDPNKEELMKILGKNKYNNHWNKSDANKAVHAFIGKKADGELAVIQCLPWNIKPWGCGGGNKGSYNNSHIQFEIQDDNYNAGKSTKAYFDECMKKAVELCAFLAKTYSIPVSEIICHKEAYQRGYASNHSDTIPWMKKYGWTMNLFREKVQEELDKLNKPATSTTTQSKPATTTTTKPATTTTTTKPATTTTSSSDAAFKKFVKEVQTALGLVADGVATTQTLSKTVTVSASKNRKHKVVKVLQKRLYELGYTEVGAADGIAGPKFTAAVKRYQKDQKCTVIDGELTAKKTTWKKMLKLK